MRSKLLFSFLILFSFIYQNISAQNWDNFGSVVSELDSSKRNDYNANLINLQNQGTPNTQLLGGAMDSLNIAINGTNPMSGFDTMLPPIGIIRNGVSGFLDLRNFNFIDSSVVMGQLDSFIYFGNTTQDTMKGLFAGNQGNLTGTSKFPSNYNIKTMFLNSAQDSLRNNQLHSFNANPANGVGNLKQFLDQLLSPQLFKRIEMYGGKQNAFANYYNFTYQTQLPVAGVRSSEQFSKRWEPRWRAQTSWFTKNQQISNNEGVIETLQKNTPFLMNASFEMMFNPCLHLFAPTVGMLRLITTLGIDAATYAPAHKSVKASNVGYTTGWGPTVGAGLALMRGNVTMYALTTMSYGNVVCTGNYVNSNYNYTSTKVEAGIRYKNNVSLRIENGLSNNWAAAGTKNVRYTQVTVGIPTARLFRR
jgi:hypothetical protein